MPKLTAEEIKAKIADGSIFAISVDTAVFDKYGCNLDSAVLKKMDQFTAGPIRVLLSEIVINEVKSHIARDAEESQRKLKKAIKEQGTRWKRALDLAAVPDEFALSGDPTQAAESQITDYLAAIGAEVVPASGVIDVSSELLRRYFATEPPFEANDKKKHEFPDGFALLSLESVAKQNQRLVLCVSPDRGWEKFADQSDLIVCEADLNLALSYFNDSGRNTADQTMVLWRSGDAPHLVEEVDRAFELRLDDADFHSVGDTGLDFDSDPISAVMQWVDLSTASDPVVIAADDETVTFTINVEAVVAFEANFSFYVEDSIDRDYVPLGDQEFSTEDRIQFQLAITVPRDLDLAAENFDVEVAKRHIEVDFGFVEPFPGEDPTHEKY